MNSELQLVPETGTAGEAPRMELQATPAANPMAMLAMAVQQNMDPEKMDKLLALQERWEANEARKAFNKAFAAFKSEAVTVLKGTQIKDGPLKGRYHANLHDVVVASTAALAKHGLSTAWKLTKDEPQWMEVTCTLRHEGGHSEVVSMAAAPDKGPGRNEIQARGSAKTYLERYTLTAILGLAATEQDDDGNAANQRPAKEQPGIVTVKPGTHWSTLTDGAWADCLSPLEDGKLSVHSKQGVDHMRDLWAQYPDHPAVCAWAADWLNDQLDETGMSWGDIRERAARTDLKDRDGKPVKPIKLPEKMTQATGRDLRVACAIVAGNLKPEGEK